MAEPDKPEKWKSIADWASALTLGKLLQMVITAFGAIILWAMLEDRKQVLAQISASPVFGGALAAGLFLMLIGAVVGGLLKRSDDNNRELFEALREQIAGLKEAAIAREKQVTAQIESLKDQEQRCQDRLFQIALQTPPWAPTAPLVARAPSTPFPPVAP